MNKNITISPSILGLDDKVSFIQKALQKGITHIHYDIMDGNFVPAKSLEIKEVEYILSKTENHIKDFHLMTFEAELWISKFKHQVDFFTIHYESESIDNLHKIIKNYAHIYKIGLAIKPNTKILEIIEFLPDLSHVLVMSVEPGKGGQKFIDNSIEKIKTLKLKLDKYNPKAFIQVDGGINPITAPLVIAAGANNLVLGSYLQKHISNKNIIQEIIGK